MPRKKLYKKSVTISPIDELEDEPEKDVSLENEDDDIHEALRSVPGGVTTIKLYRILPQGGRPKFLTELSPDMFSEAYVQDTYGGGIYKIRARKHDGKWGGNTFEIEGPPKRVLYPEQEDDEDEPEPVQPAQPVQQTQPFADPFMLMQMMQKAEERGEQRMIKMLEIMRPQQQTPDMTKQVFEIVEKLAPMMQGGEGGGSPLMMALTQFKEPIMKIIDSVHVALTRPSVTPSGTQPVQATVTQNSPQSHVAHEDDMFKVLIRQFLPMFITAARSNGNPDLYADMILEQIPQSMYPRLASWLQTPNWFDDVKVYDPIVIEAQAGWWNLLRTSLLEGLKPDAPSIQSDSTSEFSED